MAITYVNCTPHAIRITDGPTLEPSGTIVRSSSAIEAAVSPDDIPRYRTAYGPLEGLPPPAPDTVYVVSSLALDKAKQEGRTDCAAPATTHPDVVRNDSGHIVSVPGLTI